MLQINFLLLRNVQDSSKLYIGNAFFDVGHGMFRFLKMKTCQFTRKGNANSQMQTELLETGALWWEILPNVLPKNKRFINGSSNLPRHKLNRQSNHTFFSNWSISPRGIKPRVLPPCQRRSVKKEK